MQILKALAVFAAAIPVATAQAGDAGEILVSAARGSVPADRLAASLTVLDKVDIDRAGDLLLSDLLLRTPGISLSRNGGFGTATSLRIRGAESDQTVVVIDGVKLNDPASAGGGYNFANLLVGDAHRIEVLRGPQSILWGSQAIGGVVNVETAPPARETEASLDLEGGSNRTLSARAAIGGTRGPIAIRIAGQSFYTDGISAIAPEFGGVERDGYRNQSLSGQARLQFAPEIAAELRGYYSDGETDIDGTRGDSAEIARNREMIGYAGLDIGLFDGRLRNRLSISRTRTDRDNRNPDLPRAQTFDASGRMSRLSYQGNLDLTRQVGAVFGAEHEISRFRSVSPPSSLARPVPEPVRGRSAISSLYGQLNAELIPGISVSGGLRLDDHDGYGSRLLGAAGLVWTAPTGGTFRASWSQGFKAPTLYQRFSEYGNDALKPETANGWETGFEQPLFGGRAHLGATYFERRSRNLILFTSCPAVAVEPLCFAPGSGTARTGYYRNVAAAFARGVEASARVKLTDALSLDGNYSWTASEERSEGSANHGLQLPRRPRNSWSASASYQPARGYVLAAFVRGVGESFDNASHSIRLAPYTLVDLNAELPLSAEVKLVLRGDNLFDVRYQTAYRYQMPGRTLHAGVRARF